MGRLSDRIREKAVWSSDPEFFLHVADEVDNHNEAWESLCIAHDRLRAALLVSRGQWIHSVNAKQCLEALGENVAEKF